METQRRDTGSPSAYWLAVLHEIIQKRLGCSAHRALAVSEAHKDLYLSLWRSGVGAVSSADVLVAAEPKPKVKRWCCTTCGGQDVVADAWVSLNDPDDVQTFDAEFCRDCDATCHTEQREVDNE